MSRVSVIRADAEGAAYVASNMRQRDVDEVRDLSGYDPVPAVQRSVALSDEFFVARADDIPFGVFGVASAIGVAARVGVPWFLGTDLAGTQPRAMHEGGQHFTRRWRRRYRLLANLVSVKNEESVRWLARVGYVLDEPALVRPGVYARRFWMR